MKSPVCYALKMKRIGIIALATLIIVLPLYELADYAEVWAHDGDVVLPLLLLLAFIAFSFIGQTLVSLTLILLRRNFEFCVIPNADQVGLSNAPRFSATLFLIFCDFRI